MLSPCARARTDAGGLVNGRLFRGIGASEDAQGRESDPIERPFLASVEGKTHRGAASPCRVLKLSVDGARPAARSLTLWRARRSARVYGMAARAWPAHVAAGPAQLRRSADQAGSPHREAAAGAWVA